MRVQQLALPQIRAGYTAADFDAVEQDIKVIALVKGEERYVFLYNEDNRAETLRTLGRYASHPELSFTWYDAAVLSQKIRQESLQKKRDGQRAEAERQKTGFPAVPFPIDELF